MCSCSRFIVSHRFVFAKTTLLHMQHVSTFSASRSTLAAAKILRARVWNIYRLEIFIRAHRGPMFVFSALPQKMLLNLFRQLIRILFSECRAQSLPNAFRVLSLFQHTLCHFTDWIKIVDFVVFKMITNDSKCKILLHFFFTFLHRFFRAAMCLIF